MDKNTLTARECLVQALKVRWKRIHDLLERDELITANYIINNNGWLISERILKKFNLQGDLLEQNRFAFKKVYDNYPDYRVKFPEYPSGGPGFVLDDSRTVPLSSYRALNSSVRTPEVPVPAVSDKVIPLSEQVGIGLSSRVGSKAHSVAGKTNSTSTSKVFSQIGNEMEEYYKHSALLIINLRGFVPIITLFLEPFLLVFLFLILFIIIPNITDILGCSQSILVILSSIILSFCYYLA